MGRRAKNKQPAPAPLREFSRKKAPAAGKKGQSERPLPAAVKKSAAEPVAAAINGKGKRKAADDDDDDDEILEKAKAKGSKKVAKTSAKPALKQERASIFDEEEEEDEDEDDEDEFEGLDAADLDENDEASDVEYSDVDEEEEGGSDRDSQDDIAGQVDDEEEEEEEAEQMDTDEEMAALGLPKKGTKLSNKQRKKALAEAERLEELLKSQGHSLEDDEDEEEEEEEDEDVDADDYEKALKEAGADEDEEEDDEDDEEEADEEEDGDDDEGPRDDFILPTLEDRQREKEQGADLQIVQMRIHEVVAVLNNFKKLATDGRSRSEYVDQLLDDICNYYGYNRFLAERFFNMFTPSEAIELFEANETPRPITIRTNTLRTRRRDLAQALINRGVNLEPIAGKWTKVGLQVFESTVPIGATPEYLAGHYILQAASSFLPCIALAPQPNERVLDMASAPGGKSTYLSALMQNTGVVFANDSNKARTKSLSANVHRLGCKNVVVCNYDARQFPKVIGGFDRVLLDSPCSGTGVVSKDPSVKANKSERDLQLLTHLQKQLLLCAIDSVNPKSATGGYVVYSTCSILVDEDEAVVDYALKKRPNVKIVDTGAQVGRDGFTAYRERRFDARMHLAKRIYPHTHNMDGFFYCKLKVEPHKSSNAKAGSSTADEEKVSRSAQKKGDEPRRKNKIPVSVFDDDEDAALVEKTKQRQEKVKQRRRSSQKQAASDDDDDEEEA